MALHTYLPPVAAPAAWDRRWQDTHPVTPRAAAVDGSRWCGPVRNQGQEGSCSAQSGAGALDWLYRRYRPAWATWITAAAFLYQVEREFTGTVMQDTGARLRQTQAALQLVGSVPQAADPYTPDDFVIPITPTLVATAAAHRIGDGLWCPSVEEICAALDAGWIVQIGIVVTQSFESAAVAQTGLVPLPPAGDPVLGGHALLCFGYDATTLMLLNSWSSAWGKGGTCRIPHAYVERPDLFLSARAYRL